MRDDEFIEMVIGALFLWALASLLFFGGIILLRYGTFSPGIDSDIYTFRWTALKISVIIPPLLVIGYFVLRQIKKRRTQKAIDELMEELEQTIAQHNTVYDKMDNILQTLKGPDSGFSIFGY